MRTNYQFSTDDFNQNIKHLKKMLSRSKGFKISLDLKQIQLDELIGKEAPSKPNEEYFLNILISIVQE